MDPPHKDAPHIIIFIPYPKKNGRLGKARGEIKKLDQRTEIGINVTELLR